MRESRGWRAVKEVLGEWAIERESEREKEREEESEREREDVV